MNELHKYATFSIDLLGEPNRINSMFSIAKARIFYKGVNRNRTIIGEEVAERLAATIPGTPIIGVFNYDTQDFEGHDVNASAYGFVPLNPHFAWVDYNGKTYLEVDVVIWDGRFDEAKTILEDNKHLSMELNPNTMRGRFERIDNKTYYRIDFAEFAGITVLGDNVNPCFEDAQFISAYSKMISDYALYVESIQENCEGGKNIMDNITEIVEPENAVEETVEEVIVEEASVEETVEETETATAGESETVFACADKKTKCAEDKKTKCEEETENDDEAEEEMEEDYACGNKKKDKEYVCGNKKKDYELLEEELESYKEKYESLEQKYNEALNSLNNYTKKEKLEIINKFSTKLESEELIEKLTNNVNDYSLEEIKSELGQALVDQLANEEDATEESSKETNFSLNVNLNDDSLNNSAWDLVRRHKESK